MSPLCQRRECIRRAWNFRADFCHSAILLLYFPLYFRLSGEHEYCPCDYSFTYAGIFRTICHFCYPRSSRRDGMGSFCLRNQAIDCYITSRVIQIHYKCVDSRWMDTCTREYLGDWTGGHSARAKDGWQEVDDCLHTRTFGRKYCLGLNTS